MKIFFSEKGGTYFRIKSQCGKLLGGNSQANETRKPLLGKLAKRRRRRERRTDFAANSLIYLEKLCSLVEKNLGVEELALGLSLK